MLKVAIIMPIVVPTNYYYEDMTLRCIENLERFTPSELYRLVVIQGVQKSFGNKVKEMIRENDIYLGFDDNISQPKALNLGIEKTDSKYICIFSNDCFVHQNWLEPLLKALEADVCDIIGPEWRAISLNDKRKSQFENKDYKTLHCSNFRGLGMNAPVFTRELYNKIGKFDERLTRLFWDQDYAIRINKMNLRMAYSYYSYLTSLGTATINLLEDEYDKWKTMCEIAKYSSKESLDKEAKYYREKYPEEF